MAQNIEIKVGLHSAEVILQILEALSCKREAILFQTDVYYQHSFHGRLKLRIMPEQSEVIFYHRVEDGGERMSDYSLLRVDGEEALAFFDKLFPRLCVVEKERHLYLSGNTRIHLDFVKNLGTFLELESVVTGTQEEAREEYQQLYDVLNLSSYPVYPHSYSDLILEKK